ncbi:C-X-C motif chemokine 11-6-like [Triplophysa rosa]|uniref:C-X-C motif chemokine 11-6-like n=1 Tax=Triplophysa rosa TaxID=992332 RepID=UPI002545EEA1|nr:C-X-C motif chemokine 11-6-like [Triplophysa rosa]
MTTIAVFVLLVCLLVADVKGQQQGSQGRCLCADKGVDVVPRKMIEKVDIFNLSPSCEKQEIIVTLNSKRKCLNPESKFTQNLIRWILEKRAQQGSSR